MFVKKQYIPTVLKTDDIGEVIKHFFLDDHLLHVVVLNEQGGVIGVIKRNDVIKYAPADISSIISNVIIKKDKELSANEAEKIIFRELKNDNDIIAVVDGDGKYVNSWVRLVFDDSDFMKKYIYIKQRGYSIADWLHHYYGNDVSIGIHAYNENTELLLNDIRNSDIKVRFIAQGHGNFRGYKGNIIEKNFGDLSSEEIKGVSVIVNTFMTLKEQVYYLYKNHKKTEKVVSLYDIVSELYHYEKDAGYMLRILNEIAKRGRKVFVFDYPSLKLQKNRTERENDLVKGMGISKFRKLLEDKKNDRTVEEYWMPAFNKIRERDGKERVSFQEVIEEYPTMNARANPHTVKMGESSVLLDFESKYMKIRNGERVSIAPRAKVDMELHFFGKSWVFGTHCADEYTIPSMLVRVAEQHEKNYKVHNHGIGGLPEDVIMQNMLEFDLAVPVDQPFILVHMFHDYGNVYNKRVADECVYVNHLSSDRPHEYGEIWVDSGHIGEDGTELLAKQIYDGIVAGKSVPGLWTNKFNEGAGRTVYTYGTADSSFLWEKQDEYRDYKKYLCENKRKIGAIVMNCNPFTLGHRYLIEEAASRCDELYIFVVEEDRSVFPFEDRLKLVEEGTKDIKNVTILKSGRFIISAMTFPGYFSKSVDNDVAVDTSADVSFFAKSIAPNLGINIRLVGEEPFDNVTRQYNETMKRILPEYGIEFVEIPRKSINGEAISASRVRHLLENKEWLQMKPLVPETTYNYLMEHYR